MIVYTAFIVLIGVVATSVDIGEKRKYLDRKLGHVSISRLRFPVNNLFKFFPKVEDDVNASLAIKGVVDRKRRRHSVSSRPCD
jgi:hypothetical protein